MMKSLIGMPLLLFALALSAQTSVPPTATPYVVPPEIANLPNPVKATPESRLKANKTYGYDCAMCHGKDGAGDGDLVQDMKLTLTDLRDPAALKDMKDGELFYIIKNGKNRMPPEGDRAKDADIWNLVLYIRSLPNKKS